MNLEIFPTKIEGVKIIRSDMHEDDRGLFYEAYNSAAFKEADPTIPDVWLQQNISYSHQGILRGMHIQKNNPQGKLIRCLAGVIWDCWVDLRTESKTKGKWEGISLGGADQGKVEAVYIPPGLAHGFFVPSRFALVHYSCTMLYDKTSDGGIRWDDGKVGIEWPFEANFDPMVSPKDANLPTMDEYMESLR